MVLPTIELTREEYCWIPKQEEQPKNFIKYVPLGFRFRVKGSSEENAVIAEVVRGRDAFADQVGAALLSLPERFANRYRVIFSD